MSNTDTPTKRAFLLAIGERDGNRHVELEYSKRIDRLIGRMVWRWFPGIGIACGALWAWLSRVGL